MQIWPHSATLSEVGGAQAGSGPAMGGPQAGGMAGMMPAPNAGEVLLNRAETAALAALEGEEDEGYGFARASAESGLTRTQVSILKRRADHLSSKGYTLKGPNFVKKALAQSPDEPGLTRKGMKGQDDLPEAKDTLRSGKMAGPGAAGAKPTAKATAKPEPKAAKPAKKKTTESFGAVVERDPIYERRAIYTCPDMDDYRRPVPNSVSQPETGEDARETNSGTTFAALMAMKRKRRPTEL